MFQPRVFVPLLVIVAIVAGFGLSNFSKPSPRSPVSQAKMDLLYFATALEQYFVDHNAYPAMASAPEDYARSKGLSEKGIPSVMRYKGGGSAMGVTSPIAYLTQHLPDVFGGVDDTFGYYTVQTEKTSGWILWSPGPDKKYDLDWKVYDPDVEQPSPELLLFAFDSTNGALSRGDIFRVKQ